MQLVVQQQSEINQVIRQGLEDKYGLNYGLIPAVFSNGTDPVVNHHILGFTGDMIASALFSELIIHNAYFLDGNKGTEDDFFFYTVNQMKEKFHLGRTAQERALKILTKLELIERRTEINSPGVAGRYFRVKFDHPEVGTAISKYVEENNIMDRVDLFGNGIPDNAGVKAKKVERFSKLAIKTTDEVINLLNRETGHSHDPKAPGTIRMIQDLLDRGHTPNAMKGVVIDRTLEWKQSEKMNRYLRPGTLFGNGKFKQYLEQVPTTVMQRVKYTYLRDLPKSQRINEMAKLINDPDVDPKIWMYGVDAEELNEAYRMADELEDAEVF